MKFWLWLYPSTDQYWENWQLLNIKPYNQNHSKLLLLLKLSSLFSNKVLFSLNTYYAMSLYNVYNLQYSYVIAIFSLYLKILFLLYNTAFNFYTGNPKHLAHLCFHSKTSMWFLLGIPRRQSYYVLKIMILSAFLLVHVEGISYNVELKWW